MCFVTSRPIALFADALTSRRGSSIATDRDVREAFYKLHRDRDVASTIDRFVGDVRVRVYATAILHP